MSEKNNKKIEFKEWMNSQIKGNGENYSPNTISSYCSALNSKPQMLDGIEDKYKESIFSYEDVVEFEKLIPILKSAVNFEEVDESTNKAFSNAIVKYKEFLSDINLGHDGKWYPDESVYNPNITKEQRKELILDKEPSGLVSKFTTLLKSTRNLILTGAPGTGKTYLAKEIAAAMGCTENEIGFVQFHPSYDYTDFVEGLRPVSKDNCDNIGFERKDGVFKEFCKKALENLLDSAKSLKTLQEEKTIEENVIDYIENAINNNVKISLVNGGKFSILKFEKDKIVAKNRDVENGIIRVPLNDLYRLLNRTDLSDLKNVKEIKKIIPRKWSTQQDSYTFAMYKDIKRKESERIISQENLVQNIQKKPFVFIIDEINRGEVSKIFGELFYSIDPGYRVSSVMLDKVKKGEGKLYSVQTQYSNMETEGNEFDRVLNTLDYGHFFVPENVYIIGTMNDIDRSVESMDFAFRRRFAFAEVKAEDNVKLLDELEVLDLKDDAINRMNRLNSAISKIEGLSSAYHIGASYFLKLKEYGEDCRKALWNYHLEGLLREYLRGMPNADEEMRKLENAYWGNESNTNNG